MTEHYLRTELQLTQKEFSQLLRIDKSAVVHAERGRRSFSKKSNKIIGNFRDTLDAKVQNPNSTTEVSAIRNEQSASSAVILKKDIRNYTYRLAFNQRALKAMKEKFDHLIQSIENLYFIQQFPEKFEELEYMWIDLQIRLNKQKIRTCSLEKQHQLELRISEVKAGLAKAEEILRQIEGAQ